MEKIIITIILVNIEITIIQTINFEFENMMHLFTENFEIFIHCMRWNALIRQGWRVPIQSEW